MARGIRIVDAIQQVQDIDSLHVACEGKSMEVGHGFVACGGVVRQFWPKDIINQSGVVWTSDTELSRDTTRLPVIAEAICSYDARTGQVWISRDGAENGYVTLQAINPPPRGQGLYLYKFEVISGDIVTHFPEGATPYTPDTMRYDGGYYSDATVTVTGNKFTVVARFKIDQFTDANGYRTIFNMANASNYYRPLITVRDDTNADPDEQNKVVVFIRNSVGTYIGKFYSINQFADGDYHTLFLSFDGDVGDATFVIDGADEIDATHPDHVAATAGTLAGGNTSNVGTLNASIPRLWTDEIGFFGYDDQYLTNWSDFMTATGSPVEQDEVDWTNSGWGSQPLQWNADGEMTLNKGSDGNMTQNGTITKIPATPPPPVPEWHDVLEEGTLGFFENYLPNDENGTITGQAILSFAEDDGAGNPQPGTIVAKTINFEAEVLSDRICMSTEAWLLDNTEVNELAECWIVTVPDQWWDAVNEVNTPPVITGEYGYPKGVQFAEIYACTQWTPNYTMRVDQVSGDPITSPEGWQLGVDYSTDTRRRFKIEANPGEVKNAVADVTISDGNESVTKRITMRAESTQENVDPGSELSDDWTRTDEVHDQQEVHVNDPSARVQIRVDIRPDGYFDVWTLNDDPAPVGFPQKWNDAAPNVTDPQNYECRIYVSQYDSLWPATSYSVDLWFNKWQNLSKTITYMSNSTHSTSTVGTVSKDGTWIFGIREVGRPETEKRKRLKVSTQTRVRYP